MNPILNTYDQLMRAREKSLPDVAICPRHVKGTRQDWRDGWKVYRPGINVFGSPTSSPLDYDCGCRVFSERSYSKDGDTWRESRKNAFAAAIKWAGARYKIDHFVRNRYGDYVDSRVNELFPIRNPKKVPI